MMRHFHSEAPLNREHIAMAPPFRDFSAAIVVVLVALPLCLGIALSSNAPLTSGLVSGIVGGIVVGLLSGSHTSISGPSAGYTAVVATQIAILGSFEAFLAALFIAGIIQLFFGIIRAGIIAEFVPTSVINGLLGAIGVILILKQVPHVFGHDIDPEGDMAFYQPDNQNTFSELLLVLNDFQVGATIVGILSVVILIIWERTKWLKKSPFPAPLVVVAAGIALGMLFKALNSALAIEPTHMVQIPDSGSLSDLKQYLISPDWAQLNQPSIYSSALMIALVTSLEALLNLEAVDKIDPLKRKSPPNRELVAQGFGNMMCGLLGGLPVTSVIVRSSVNINAGGRSRWVAIIHGLLLVCAIAIMASWVNQIPLACLAAILLVTGFNLVNPKDMLRMWRQGPYQFVPFIVTLVAIVFTDLLIGTILGLLASITFILYSNFRRPVRRILERHAGGDLLRVELASQMSFFNRAGLMNALRDVPDGGSVLIDASNTVYIDPDIQEMIRMFRDEIAPLHNIRVSTSGFQDHYTIDNQTQFVDYVTKDLQERLNPHQILEILQDGNERFRTGNQLRRNLGRQIEATKLGQHPLAIILSCIDSRTPSELVFDMGLGDIFSVRIAGNIIGRKVMGSLEFGCAVAGAKLILVMGHTSCGAVTAAVRNACGLDASDIASTCEHLGFVAGEITRSMTPAICREFIDGDDISRQATIDAVARNNVKRVVSDLVDQSSTLRALLKQEKIAIVGGMYDVSSGKIEIITVDPARSDL